VLRRLFILGSALSLVLCLTAGVMWIRSYWKGETFTSHFPRRADPQEAFPGFHYFYFVQVSSCNGCLTSNTGKSWSPSDAATPKWAYEGFAPTPGFPPPSSQERFGFYWNDGDDGLTHAGIPWCFLTALFAVLPARKTVLLRRSRTRRRKGLCLACGYDLRASKIRCPECGAAVPAAPAG
jgi:hypothetical protein